MDFKKVKAKNIERGDDFMVTKADGADRVLYKPPGWIPLTYVPKSKVESESHFHEITTDKLQHEWTLWVMVNDMQQ